LSPDCCDRAGDHRRRPAAQPWRPPRRDHLQCGNGARACHPDRDPTGGTAQLALDENIGTRHGLSELRPRHWAG